MVQFAGEERTAARPVSRASRVPPHNLEAEESLIGAMLLSRDAITAAVEARVDASDFYKPAHGHIFDAIWSLYEQGEPVDPVTVAEELRRANLLEPLGGKATLLSIQASTPASANAAHYAKIVSELALLRRLITVSGEIAESAYAQPDDVTETVDRAEAMVFEVAEKRIAESMVKLFDSVTATVDQLETLYGEDDTLTGVPTGYTDLDSILLGLQPSNLVIVAARPGQGKTAFALGAAANVAMVSRRPVVFFSMEMGAVELTKRMLASEARVEGRKLQTGNLSDADWSRLNPAISHLGEAPFFIDDNPHCTVMEMRAKARRIKARHGDLGLIVVDYLQLMSSPRRAESRQVEVSELSRGLKILARELDTPVVALSQLNRQLEYRQDKRPMLADLRESGCLTAGTRVVRADTNAEVSLGELLESGERDVPVWTLDERLRLVQGTMTNVFPSGTKEAYALRLRSGRVVEASGNHPFLRLGGWTPLEQLAVGDRVAVPRRLPAPRAPEAWPEARVILLAHLLGDGCHLPRHALQYTTTDPANVAAVSQAAREAFGITARVVAERGWTQVYLPAPHRVRNPASAWLDELGLLGARSWQKFVPPAVFAFPDEQVALFLRHLWATDGCVWSDRAARGAPRVYYASTSRRLAEDVRSLLLRLGIRSRVKELAQGSHRPGYHVVVQGREDQLAFVDRIGVHGARAEHVEPLRAWHRDRRSATNIDTVPIEVWEHVRCKAMPDHGVTARELAERIGMRYCGSALYKSAPSRERTARLARALPDDPWLDALATSDVFWDEVVAVEPLGPQPVFDATVSGTHNFIADGVIVHNSIEQDADVVLFLYRDEAYNPESDQRGVVEIIVAKHRNGPTGTARLAFLDHYVKFANMARE